MKKSPRFYGFTLVELSVVLIIIALVTGMGLMAGTGAIENAKRAQTGNKINEIEKALLRFRTRHERLPCPGDPSFATSHASYGKELRAGLTVVCTTGNSTTPPFLITNTSAGTYIVEGSLPTKALGLPDEYMYDGWGRKFAYAIDPKLANTNAFIFIPPAATSCSITVHNGAVLASGNRTTGGAYVLLSAWPNGHGGYTKAGTRNNASSTNANEQSNCHCDASAASAAPADPFKYVQRDLVGSATATAVFDDITRFKERWQLQNDADFKKSANYKDYEVAL